MKRLNPPRGYTVDVMAGRPPTKEATAFGQRVAAARQRRGLTQRELAERLDVSLAMVEYYERRATNVKSDVVRKLAEVLNISADELLGVRGPKAKPGPRSKLRRLVDDLEELPRSKQQFVSQVIEQLLAAEKA